MIIYAQETGIKSPYFKVLKSENIDFRDTYSYKDFYFSDIFKVENNEFKKVNFRNKYGIYNMTQNKWVVNIQFNSIDYVRDSLFRLRFSFERYARLIHLDPNSIYSLEGEFQIEINKDGLLLNAFTDKPLIYNPRTNKKINLEYNSANLIGDSLILVRNYPGLDGQSNLVDFKGNLLLNKWWKHITFRNGEYFTSINGNSNRCDLESKIDFSIKDISNEFISDKGNIKFQKNFNNKYIAIINNKDTLPFVIDTFYINNENDLIVKTGKKYCILCSSRLGNLRDFTLNNQVNLFDSLSNDSYSVRIFNNKKAGLLTSFNSELAKPNYDNIFLFGNFKNERYAILNKNKISVYDYNNKLIKECPCDQPFSIASKKEKPIKELVVCFQKNGEVLTYDVSGNIVPKSRVWFTNESLQDLDIDNLTHNTIFRINDDYGLISKEKKIIIPPYFDYVYKTSIEGIYLLNETTFKEKYVHLMDIKTGKKVSYPGFRLSKENSHLKYVELKDRDFKSTYYEVYQNPVRLIPITFFDEMINPNSRTIIVCKKDKYGMESLKGNTLINTKYNNCFQVTSGITACKDESKKYAIFDERGTILTKHKFDSIVSLNWHILTTNKDTITLFNTNFENGTKLTELRKIYGYNFIKKNSLVFIVEKNGKFGVFDMNGNEKLKAEYDQIMATKDYISIFKRDGKLHFSPSNENEIFKNGVDTAFFFKNVQHQDDHGVIIYKFGTKYGLHRPNLQFTEAIFDDIYEIHGDFLLIENDRKLGLYDIKRKAYILNPEYNGIFFKSIDDVTLIKNDVLQKISIIQSQ
jgi:hypothetical protein